MRKYSLLNLVRHGLKRNQHWQAAWPESAPRSDYDIVIIGGGSHGLATAYYLARQHGLNRIAVIDAGWIGGGNAARNMTIIRSNYAHPASVQLYEYALRLWESLAQELNFNVMFSQRGVLNLLHGYQEVERAHQLIDGWTGTPGLSFLSPAQLKKVLPHSNLEGNHPVRGGLLQQAGGTVRHDAVVWAYARAASALGVDIVEHCPVEGIIVEAGRVTGVQTSAGRIRAGRVAIVAAADSSSLAGTAGVALPVESRPLQCLVSEPLKLFLDQVVMSDTLGAYLNQTSKGDLVIGTSVDQYSSHKRQGSYMPIEYALAGAIELFPVLGRVRMNRQWGGNVDISPDASPIIGKTPVDGLYLNCGWGTGGFKATPASGVIFAQTLATGKPHGMAQPFGLSRFESGELVDENASTGVAH